MLVDAWKTCFLDLRSTLILTLWILRYSILIAETPSRNLASREAPSRLSVVGTGPNLNGRVCSCGRGSEGSVRASELQESLME